MLYRNVEPERESPSQTAQRQRAFYEDKVDPFALANSTRGCLTDKFTKFQVYLLYIKDLLPTNLTDLQVAKSNRGRSVSQVLKYY